MKLQEIGAFFRFNNYFFEILFLILKLINLFKDYQIEKYGI